jgi:hypothetical protein
MGGSGSASPLAETKNRQGSGGFLGIHSLKFSSQRAR